jgi:hypothetical protein
LSKDAELKGIPFGNAAEQVSEVAAMTSISAMCMNWYVRLTNDT